MGADEGHRIALDAALHANGQFFSMLDSCIASGSGITGFAGYPFLQQIQQSPLIQAGVTTLADEMTRKFVELKYAGDGDTGTLIETISADMKTFEVRDLFREAACFNGYYGGCLVYIDTGTADEYLETPLYLDPVTFSPGSLKRFVLVDPINVYPGNYNASQPLRPDYFRPSTWMVLGQRVHASRFLYFSGPAAPLLFKPSYNFFGIPKAQMAWDYAVNFTGSRESATRLLNKFSLTAFKTNMAGVFQGLGVADVEARVQYFAEKRNNDGIFLMDKDQEDLIQINAPISGVTDIARQALEFLAMAFRIPAVKFIGFSPNGFNASGDADLENFWIYVQGQQEKELGLNLNNVLQILQMNRTGRVDDKLVFEWLPLNDKADRTRAEVQKLHADTAAVYVNAGVLAQEEVRQNIAEDPASGYNSIDVDNVPPAPEPQGFGGGFA